MAVLKKAVLIDYTKLKDMIDHGTIDNETVYFLSGKDLHDKIKDIDTKIESKADQTSIPNISNLATKQEVTDVVAAVQVPSIEGLAKTTEVESTYAKKTELQHLTAGEGITISEAGVISASAPQVDLSDYVKDESLSLDGLDLVAKYEAAKIKYDNPLANTETANPGENH
jgi:hypothetical protein